MIIGVLIITFLISIATISERSSALDAEEKLLKQRSTHFKDSEAVTNDIWEFSFWCHFPLFFF